MTHEHTTATVRKRMDELTTLRDELKVRAHLGAMDSRNAWDKIRRQIASLESEIAADATHVAVGIGASLEGVAAALKRLGERLAVEDKAG